MMLGIKNVGYRLGMENAHKMFKRKFHRQNSFYDALGITPKATQADIKKAFYKLSMQFHPDKSTGNDIKFKEISAAYEVLGNLKLRRLYDRGMLPAGVASVHDAEMYEEKSESQFSKRYPNNLDERQKREPMTGRTEQYNYDEWYRAHYAETFTRNDRNRSKWMDKKAHRIAKTAQARTEAILWLLGGLVLSLLFYTSRVQRQWDKPQKRQEREEN